VAQHLRSAVQRSRAVLALSALSLFSLAVAARRQEPAERSLSVRYLANEGFLLRSGDETVVIDAFVGKPYSMYAALPSELLQQLTAAKPPFDEVDLALTSHIHRDHFQADVAHQFLAADRDVPMWSSEQVIAAVRAEAPALPESDARLKAFWCPSGEKRSAKLASLEVEFFPLFHVADIQNLGHLIRIGKLLVLHAGDAVLDEKEYAPYELSKRGIDLALVPYSYLLEKQDCEATKKWIGAHTYVAMHVPPKEFADVRRTIAANLPGVVMLEKGGDEFDFVPGGAK
jgi:L-ascorbate metabolism protein UlaG (beta-lactamase superfamily)